MNARDEAATVLILFLLYIIILYVAGFPYGNSPIGEMGDYVGLILFASSGVIATYCVLSKVCDDDSSREKEMRRQIELEKQKTRKPNDDEQRDWILR